MGDGEQDQNQRLKEQMELLKFLREESEANRQAQREDAVAGRKLLTDTFKIAAIVLVPLLAIATWLFAHDLNTLKESLKLEAEADTKVEIEKEKKEIAQTLQDQFQTDKIKATVKEAAQSATREQAPGLIKEVITPEVRNAVDRQSGTIKDISTKAASERVEQEVSPLVGKANVTLVRLHIQELIGDANLDDAKAFDELLLRRATEPPEEQSRIDSLIADRRRHERDRLGDGGCPDPESASSRIAIASRVMDQRRNAVAGCNEVLDAPFHQVGQGQWVESFRLAQRALPVLVKVALEDQSLTVRAAAVDSINFILSGCPEFPEGGFDLLETDKLRGWWKQNEPNYKALALLARAQQRRDDLDLISFYEELRQTGDSEPIPLRQLAKGTAEGMLSRASTNRAQKNANGFFRGRNLNSCSDVEGDLRNSMEYQRKYEDPNRDPWANLQDVAQLELGYLESCEPDSQLISAIASYGTSTHSLSGRYWAITVVNKWAGTKLDPFQTKPLAEWLKQHPPN